VEIGKKTQGVDTFGAEYGCAVKITSKVLDPGLQNTKDQSSTNASFQLQSAVLEGTAISLQLPIQDLSGTEQHLLPYNVSSQSALSISDNFPSTMQETHDSVPSFDPIDRSNNGSNDFVEATGYSDNALVVSQYHGTEGDSDQKLTVTSNVTEATYGADFDAEFPPSKEEKRKDVKVVPQEKDIESLHKSHRKDKVSSKKKPLSGLQAKSSAKLGASSIVHRPPRFPRRACVVHKDEQYSLDAKLLPLPRATKYLVKRREEISLGRFMAKLVLHCAR